MNWKPKNPFPQNFYNEKISWLDEISTKSWYYFSGIFFFRDFCLVSCFFKRILALDSANNWSLSAFFCSFFSCSFFSHCLTFHVDRILNNCHKTKSKTTTNIAAYESKANLDLDRLTSTILLAYTGEYVKNNITINTILQTNLDMN